MKAVPAVAASSLLLCLTAVGASAQDIYHGTLSASVPFTINIDATGGSQGAVTVLYFGESQRATDEGARGDSLQFDLFDFPGIARTSFVDVRMPRKTRRIIIEVHSGTLGVIEFELTQGSFAHRTSFSPGGSIAFDVTP